ncbi:MAG: radical SAM protein [Phycisphaerae bacterium]|nr:radical SAM protein [Phycisphaerae bacterium]
MTSELRPILCRIERAPEELTGHPRHIHPALDLKYIQAAIKQETGETIEFLDGWLQRWSPGELVEQVLARGCGIAVIKAMTPCIDESVEVGAALRRAGVITIAVGQQVNHVAYQACPGWHEAFDIPVLGDPEQAVPELIRRLRSGESASAVGGACREKLQRREPFLVDDPNGLAQPEFTRDELARYPFPFPIPGRPPRVWGYLLSAWGCPHRCTHCSGVVRKTYGSLLRTRCPKSLVDEIAALLGTGSEAIIFEDDTLLCDRENFLALCEEIDRRGLRFPWIAHARPDELDAERVAAAAKAGAALFKVGVESGSGRVIESLGKSRSGEGWLRHIETAFENLHAHKVGAVALFLVGSPGETEEDVEKSIELAIRLRSDYIQVQVYCAYPDSPYYIGLDEAQSALVQTGSQYHYDRPQWSPSMLPPEELLHHQSVFYRRYYLRPAYALHHLRRFWRFYLDPRTAYNHIVGMVGWVAGLRGSSRIG